MNSWKEETGLLFDWHLSEADQLKLLQKLWELLKWQVGKYNGIDSTSMPVEKAQEQLNSLLYTFSVVVAEDNIPTDVLLQQDFQSVIRRGQEILDNKRKSGKIRWNAMCLSAPQIQNVYYIDTMKNIGVFYQRYDIYYGAHEIPCSIDYPLMNSISEDIKGISYIEEYVKRITIENRLIQRFDQNIVIRLYESSFLDYKESYFNLCEPVLINALGLKLVGQDIWSLDVSKEQKNEILMLLKDKTQEERHVVIQDAAKSVYREVEIKDSYISSYFDENVQELMVRIDAAILSDDWSNIFVSLLHEE